MGATYSKKIQVLFTYCLNSLTREWQVNVIANVYPGRYDNFCPRDLQTGTDEETTAEIVSAVLVGEGKPKCWDDIPAFIREDMEQRAIEEAYEKQTMYAA